MKPTVTVFSVTRPNNTVHSMHSTSSCPSSSSLPRQFKKRRMISRRDVFTEKVLSTDTLVLILLYLPINYLPSARLVCHHWAYVCHREVFYWRFELLKALRYDPVSALEPLSHISLFLSTKHTPTILDDPDIQMCALAMINSGNISQILHIMLELAVSRECRQHKWEWTNVLAMLSCQLLKFGYPEHASMLCSALHMWETYHLFVPSGNASQMVSGQALRLTAEQEKVVTCEIRPNEVIKVLAFAGSGKTTTALQFIAHHSRKRILYVCFNKSLQLETQQRLDDMGVPRWRANSSTLHSLAFQTHGRRYQHKMAFSMVTATQIVDMFKWTNKRTQRYAMAKIVLRTLQRFLYSSESKIISGHVNEYQIGLIEPGEGMRFTSGECLACARNVWKRMRFTSGECLACARNVWKRMKDTNNADVCMTHDGYMKLYQLDRSAVLRGYDIVVVDEAQDLSRCQADIIMRMPCAKLLIGDNYQEIYSWRGSFKFLEDQVANKTFYLPHSWRFGMFTAQVLNSIIAMKQSTFHPESPHLSGLTILTSNSAVVGDVRKSDRYFQSMDDLDSLYTPSTHEDYKKPPPISSRSGLWQSSNTPAKQICVINRSNSNMFSEALLAASEGRSIAFHSNKTVEGGESFKMIRKLFNLFSGTSCRVKISGTWWSSFGESEKFAKDTDDRKLLDAIAVVDKYRYDTLKKLETIQKHIVPTPQADVILTTAHTSKGCEWDCVKVADDFLNARDLDILKQHPTRSFGEELNLLYVACSRAKTKLILSNIVRCILISSIPTCLVVREAEVGKKALCTGCDGKFVTDQDNKNESSSRRVVMHENVFSGKKTLFHDVSCQIRVASPFGIGTRLAPDSDNFMVNPSKALKLSHSYDSLIARLDLGSIVSPLLHDNSASAQNELENNNIRWN
eukprot:941513_1